MMLSRKIDLIVEFKDYGEQKVVAVMVYWSNICELSTLLVLLREELVTVLEIAFRNFTLFLRLSKDESSVCSLLDLRKRIMEAAISLNSLGYLLYFLLRYYRDGTGPVDHVDLDFDFENEPIVTWTVKVDAFNTMSPEEINKLMRS
jgi:hypothetical protein